MAIEPVIAEVDRVLVMSVNPGFGGQSFIEAVRKGGQDGALVEQRGREGADVEVDGGVDHGKEGRVVAAGADVLVAGAAVFGRGPEDRGRHAERIAALRAAV